MDSPWVVLTSAIQIDVTHWMARTALELIGQSGLGYTFDALTENAPEHPYVKAAKMYM